jgi:ADP-L-glycero-D-manno-heptose 6-epimerase
MASVAFQAHRVGKFKLFPGNPKRDFVYIKDVVSATIYPIFNDISKGVYEVGSGEARTFEDVLDLMEVEYVYRDESDIPKGYQYFTQAKKTQFIKGWEPIYNLEDGLIEYKGYLEDEDISSWG